MRRLAVALQAVYHLGDVGYAGGSVSGKSAGDTSPATS
jgi:hypothetical protein